MEPTKNTGKSQKFSRNVREDSIEGIKTMSFSLKT